MPEALSLESLWGAHDASQRIKTIKTGVQSEVGLMIGAFHAHIGLFVYHEVRVIRLSITQGLRTQ